MNSIKIQNDTLKDFKVIAREIRRSKCAENNDHVLRRFILMHTFGSNSVALDARWAAVGKMGVLTGMKAPDMIDWFNIQYDRYLRILIAQHIMKKNIILLLRAKRCIESNNW